MIGVNDDNGSPRKQGCLYGYKTQFVRFALSLGLLLGMSHGWVTAEGLQQQPVKGFDSIETVNSATQSNPFSSRSHQFFPY
ncbi:hypothetical protein Syncc9605_2645 [Synechococcus sp. CC9605]|nr:hypothetical protein Syncc9605_2645 [Synechococcus sp. CC9605]